MENNIAGQMNEAFEFHSERQIGILKTLGSIFFAVSTALWSSGIAGSLRALISAEAPPAHA